MELIIVLLKFLGSTIKIAENKFGLFAVKYNIASAPIDCPVP